MTPVQIPVRDTILEVSDGAPTTPTWTEVGGLTKFTLKPGENEEVQETATFDSDGQYEEYKMQRGATIELEGKLYADPDDDTRDPGQQAIEDNAAAVGVESRGQIRFRRSAATEWKVWDCTTTSGEQGGETNETTGFQGTFTRCGKSTTMAVV